MLQEATLVPVAATGVLELVLMLVEALVAILVPVEIIAKAGAAVVPLVEDPTLQLMVGQLVAVRDLLVKVVLVLL
jgi:hypothetical protein